MERQITHSGLGTLTGHQEEWHAREPLEMTSLGFSTSNVVIIAADPEGEPTSDQLDAVMDLARSPSSFKDALAKAIFDAYQKDIYPQYERMLSNPDYTYEKALSDLPRISGPREVWQFVTDLYGIWADAEGTINLQFNVTFDEEHQLNVHMAGGAVDFVCME